MNFFITCLIATLWLISDITLKKIICKVYKHKTYVFCFYLHKAYMVLINFVFISGILYFNGKDNFILKGIILSVIVVVLTTITDLVMFGTQGNNKK